MHELRLNPYHPYQLLKQKHILAGGNLAFIEYFMYHHLGTHKLGFFPLQEVVEALYSSIFPSALRCASENLEFPWESVSTKLIHSTTSFIRQRRLPQAGTVPTIQR